MEFSKNFLDIGIDLDEDFDPYKWDQKMNELYNDDFYNQEIDDSKAINYDEDLGQSLDFPDGIFYIHTPIYPLLLFYVIFFILSFSFYLCSNLK